MKHIFTGLKLIGAFAFLALAVGCASMQTQSKENLLIAAGFKVIVPHTAVQQQKLQALPVAAGVATLRVPRRGATVSVAWIAKAGGDHWALSASTPSVVAAGVDFAVEEASAADSGDDGLHG